MTYSAACFVKQVPFFLFSFWIDLFGLEGTDIHHNVMFYLISSSSLHYADCLNVPQMNVTN